MNKERYLIIEDDQDSSECLKSVIDSELPSIIDVALTAKKAAALLNDHEYKWIIVDHYFLMKYKWFDILSTLKRHTRVLVISSFPLRKQELNSLHAEFLAKPFNISSIISTLES